LIVKLAGRICLIPFACIKALLRLSSTKHTAFTMTVMGTAVDAHIFIRCAGSKDTSLNRPFSS